MSNHPKKKRPKTCQSCMHQPHEGKVCTSTHLQAHGRPWQCGCDRRVR